MATTKVDRKQEEVPGDVYIQFVRSLFDSASILLIGGICYAVVALMVYFQTNNVVYIGFAVALFAANMWRYLDIKNFQRSGSEIQSVEEAGIWERRYIVRGCAQGLAVGAFAFASIWIYPNTFAEVASVALALSAVPTVSTRNYGSPAMVRILSTLFIAPVAFALILRLEVPHVALGLLMLSLIHITIMSSGHLRNVLFSAVTGHKRAKQLAQRFDRALNTMPQGLLMFNQTGQVIVANAEAALLMDMKSPDAMLGRSISALLLRIVAARLLDMDQYRYASLQLTGALRQGFDRKLVISLKDGRSFELSAREGQQNIGVVIFEDITSRVRAENRISTMARFDSLTTLPNRAHFHEMVAERLSGGDPKRNCALAIFDLDDFKAVNDSLGHPVGDELIRAVSERIASLASKHTIVSRFGGDEFVFFWDDIESPAALRIQLDALAARMGGLLEVSGNRLRVQASGGAVFGPAAAAELDALIVRADLALHRAKERGKNGWCLFEEAMEQAFRSRQLLKADLRTAVDQKGLRVVYQPIVSVDSMKIASCEALCRWDHPELGPISPATFIPLAEETGIISDITTFMLESACAECTKWPHPLSVSVNLSAKDFRDASIIDKVDAALRMTGLAPERLEIEVTETSLLDDKSAARRYVEELRQIGVRIALDDFGTGYSSLSYLHKLPLDKIKIDRSFLTDVTEDERSLRLLSGVVQLSHRLGLQVTVEGVETFEQFKMLSADVKPDLVQGFLFGSALSASGIETMSTTAWPFPSAIPKQAAVARR
ncbi:MAG: putative bifunctional diguanylate cyclase/phosphodiesterase [Rhizobiaceae bacterium]